MSEKKFDGRRVYRRRFNFFSETRNYPRLESKETAVKPIYQVIIMFAFRIDLLEIVFEAVFPSTLFISYTPRSVHRPNAMNV